MKILIFAEGTTTNGDGIIDLKKGAFILNRPITVSCLKYNSSFGNGFTLIGLGGHILGQLMNLSNNVEYIVIDS